MFMIKKMCEDTWVYRGKDENDHYIVEDWMCNEYEMDYFDSVSDIAKWVNISMDSDTEIMVIPVREILDCPLKDWFLFY